MGEKKPADINDKSLNNNNRNGVENIENRLIAEINDGIKASAFTHNVTKENKEEIDVLEKEAEILAMAVDEEILTGEIPTGNNMTENKIKANGEFFMNEENEKNVYDKPLEKENLNKLPDKQEKLKVKKRLKKEKEEKIKEKEEVIIEEIEEKAKEGGKQVLKYAMFAASAGLIQFIVSSILFACLPDMGNINVIITMKKSQFIANTVGLALSILWNFTFNRKFTFKSAGNVPRAMFLSFLFYVPFYPFQIWCEPTLAHAIAPGQVGADILALVVVMLTNGVLEFCWQKFFIYRKEENTAVKTPKSKKA